MSPPPDWPPPTVRIFGIRLVGQGSTCNITTTDGKTVLKGYQYRHEGKVPYLDPTDFSPGAVLYARPPCEERLAREHAVYEHLGEHPQVLRSFGLEEIRPGIHSLRLELAPLGSVRSCTENEPPPPMSDRFVMALDVAKGLSFLHSKGVFVNDFCSTNLLVFPGWRVKYGDFGAATIEGRDFVADDFHEARYIVPFRGRMIEDIPPIKQELFALGMAIYEITAWEKPFPDLGREDWKALDRYEKGECPSLEGNIAAEVIRKCWNEDYESAQQVLDDSEKLEEVFKELF